MTPRPPRTLLAGSERHRPETGARPPEHAGGARNGDQGGGELRLAIPDALIDTLAERVAARLEATAPAAPPAWLDVDAAAAYLACSRQRIYDLTSQGRLRSARDGRRRLYRREWLDAYVLGQGDEEGG